MEEIFVEPRKSKTGRFAIMSVVFILIALFLLFKIYGRNFLTEQQTQNKIVELSSDYLQSLCPIKLPGLGKVQKISMNDDDVTFYFFVSEADDSIRIDINAINKNEEKAVDLAMIEVQGTTDTLREVMKQIASKELSLIFDVKGDNGGYGKIRLNPQQIREALKRMPFINEFDFSLNAIANTNRMLLPLQVDPITEWVDVELTKNDYVYVYVIDDSQCNIHNIDMVAQKETTYNKLKENQKDLKNIIEGCDKTRRGIIYRYISKWSRETNGFHIWPEEVHFADDDVIEDY